MKYKEVLARYVQKRLTELSEVDEYEPNKLALTNLLWFLGKVTSSELIVARLKIMIDADLKRKEYLSKFDNALFNDASLDGEYSKGTSTIGKECLAYLRKQRTMKQADYIRLTAQIAVLKEIAVDYSGKTIDNIIQQLEAIRKEVTDED